MSDPLVEFLQAPTVDQLEMIKQGQAEDELRRYLGAEAYGELQTLAAKVDRSHLSVRAPKNLIFVPGVMGSQLLSKTKGGVWWIDVRNRKLLNELALSADGAQDSDPDNQIAPFTTDPQYMPFFTAALAQDDFNHELFPFDWRKLPTRSADDLRDLVKRVHAENGGVPIHLVGHSMGGLMIRAALMKHGDELWPLLGKVLFIATPHYGSPAIAGYLKNHLWGFNLMAVMGLYINRQTFRSLWGVLAMLPAPRGIYPGTRPNDSDPWTGGGDYAHPCANFDMYRVDTWKLDLNDQENTQLQRVLDGAADFHRQLYEWHDAMTQDVRDRMAVIAGVGIKTLFRLEYESHLFGAWERMEKVTKREKGNRHREGDGRVPLASAELENVPVRYVRGVHGGLPNMRPVYEAVFRHLRGQDLGLGKTPQEALSAHLGALDPQAASEAPALDGTGLASAAQDGDPDEVDAGLWELELDQAELDHLRDRLEQEELPEFTRVRLL